MDANPSLEHESDSSNDDSNNEVESIIDTGFIATSKDNVLQKLLHCRF
jgi:hypothetical protein